MTKRILESDDMQAKKADYYAALIPNEPIQLDDTLFITSVNDSLPKQVTYRKHPERGTYVLSRGKMIYFESVQPIRTTQGLTRALAGTKTGATHLVCRTFGEATIAHQYLVGDDMVYRFAMAKAKIKWLATTAHIQFDYRMELLRIDLVYVRDMAKYMMRGQHR